MDRSKNRSSSKGGSSSKTLDKKSSSRRTSEFRDLKASSDKYSSSTFKEKEEKYDDYDDDFEADEEPAREKYERPKDSRESRNSRESKETRDRRPKSRERNDSRERRRSRDRGDSRERRRSPDRRESSPPPQRERRRSRERRSSRDRDETPERRGDRYEQRHQNMASSSRGREAFDATKFQVFSSPVIYKYESVERQKRRSGELYNKIVELDTKSFTILDLNPSALNSALNARQLSVKVQTNDERTDLGIQTDEILESNLWTQHPGELHRECGTDTINAFESKKPEILNINLTFNQNAILKLLNRSANVLNVLFERSNEYGENDERIKKKQTDIQFSEGFSVLSIRNALKNKSLAITNCAFCESDNTKLVCSFETGRSTESKSSDLFGYSTLFAIWNTKNADQSPILLLGESKSTAIYFGPFIIISGNEDGTLSVWDLRETRPDKSYASLKLTPTYITVSNNMALNETHSSEVRAIVPLQLNRKNESGNSIFKQIASLEVESRIILWTIFEAEASDVAKISDAEVGMRYGGKIKLIRNQVIDLNGLTKVVTSAKILTTNLAIPTMHNNILYVTKNYGKILQIERRGTESKIKQLGSRCDDYLTVTSISLHHQNQELLLACYLNGEIKMFHEKYVMPIKTWSIGLVNQNLNQIYWIESQIGSFLVVDETGTMYFWNLIQDDTQSLFSKQMPDLSQVAFSKAVPNKDEGKDLRFNQYFALPNMASNDVEVHTVAQVGSDGFEKQKKKFARLIKNYLLNF